jgi:hypothetical protein
MAEMDIERMFRDAGDWECQLWVNVAKKS